MLQMFLMPTNTVGAANSNSSFPDTQTPPHILHNPQFYETGDHLICLRGLDWNAATSYPMVRVASCHRNRQNEVVYVVTSESTKTAMDVPQEDLGKEEEV